MKAIKAVAIGMGALIIAGLGLLGYGVYSGAGRAPGAAAAAKTSGAARAPASLRAFGERTVSGDEILGMRAQGARLYVLVRDGGVNRIHVLDAATGAALGTVSASSGQP